MAVLAALPLLLAGSQTTLTATDEPPIPPKVTVEHQAERF